MNTQIFTNNESLGSELRVPRFAQSCFKWAERLAVVQPTVVLVIGCIVLVLQAVSPAVAQTTAPIITGGDSSAPFKAVRTLVRYGIWALVVAGIGGIGWAFVNGMRRHAWLNQLIFGIACLGFSGIVSLLTDVAAGNGPE